jgi:hypothetical protein
MITIAEVPEYIREAEKLLTAAERQDVLSYLATHPKSGDLIEGTSGIRKLRWARQEWRGAGDLLLPQRVDAALFVDAICQERAGQLEQGRTQWHGKAGGYIGCYMA